MINGPAVPAPHHPIFGAPHTNQQVKPPVFDFASALLHGSPGALRIWRTPPWNSCKLSGCVNYFSRSLRKTSDSHQRAF
jgi:hypothetical protein